MFRRFRTARVAPGVKKQIPTTDRAVRYKVSSTRRLIALARETRRRIHVLHVTTAEEAPILAAAKDIATAEVTPQHLTLEAPARTWLVVLAPPSRMERRGLPRTMLTPGTKATVVGYPSRSDPEEMRAERITVDGKTVELR